MAKLGGSALVILGIFLVVAGWFIGSSLVEWILDVIKVILIIAGIAVGAMGAIQMLKGDKSSSSY